MKIIRMLNRNNNQILTHVLDLTQSKIRATDLIRKTNTNHGRIKNILYKLTSTEMVVKFDNFYVITPKGRLYLENWKKFYDFSQSFGLEI